MRFVPWETLSSQIIKSLRERFSSDNFSYYPFTDIFSLRFYTNTWDQDKIKQSSSMWMSQSLKKEKNLHRMRRIGRLLIIITITQNSCSLIVFIVEWVNPRKCVFHCKVLSNWLPKLHNEFLGTEHTCTLHHVGVNKFYIGTSRGGKTKLVHFHQYFAAGVSM